MQEIATPLAGTKGRGNKGYHEDQVLNTYHQIVFDKDRAYFTKWAKGMRILLQGHGFKHAEDYLIYAASQKKPITVTQFDTDVAEMELEDVDPKEHNKFNDMLCQYLELFTEGEAGGLVESITESADKTERMNGAEAWELITKRIAPKTTAAATKLQREAMKIGEAKNHDEIWQKIQYLEKLERIFKLHSDMAKGFDETTKMRFRNRF